MQSFLPYLPLASVVAAVLVAALLWKLRGVFPERAQAVTPLELNTTVQQNFEKFRASVVNEINTSIAQNGTNNMLRYDSIDRSMADIRETLREIRQKVEIADSKAVEAVHAVHILTERADGRDRLVDQRLSDCEGKLERRQGQSNQER